MENSKNYHDEQNNLNTIKMRQVVATLPSFCKQFFRGIQEYTSSRTRLAYAYDLRVFFEFIHSHNSVLGKIEIIDFPISVLDQITREDIEEYLHTPIIRVMPNTPVSVNAGVIAYCQNELVSKEDLSTFLNDFKDTGLIDRVDEKLFDAVSALSGSGPAFIYELIEALADGAVLCGMPRDKAYKYASYTILGAAKMQLETNLHPGILKDQVTSPSGSTIEGLKVLEENSFRGIIINCVKSTFDKNKKLK